MIFSSSSLDLCSPPYVSASLSRPVSSLLQKEPGWKAGGHTKPLLLYCRLQRKLKEGIVARRKPLHYVSPCRQNNECINAKKHALTHLLHFCAHSYLYLYLHVLPADAFTHRPPIEPVKEWAADKVGQRSYFYGCSLCGVCRVLKLPQKRGCFFFLTWIWSLSHLFFWHFNGVSSACAEKSFSVLPDENV